MVLRRGYNNQSERIEPSTFLRCFQAIFAGLILFQAVLIGGLFYYGSWAAIAAVIQQPEFHFALKLTLWTSLVATALTAFVALPSGYVLSRCRIPGQAFVDTLLDIPIVLPPLISGIALLILFGPLLGEHLTKLGLEIVFSPRGVVIAQWFIATPFAIKAIKQAFDSIDPRMEKVARTLGFTPGRVFCKVTLPLAKNGIISGLIMAWTRALGEFGATAMLAGITRMKTETLSVAIFLNMTVGDLEFAISTAIVMLMIALISLVILKVFLRTEVMV
ncbi:MAG: ABC transporter permease [Syntrophomonadaceae bacterium]|nr:ABC transporter permease [Syntrophomonadaceae bacterium]